MRFLMLLMVVFFAVIPCFRADAVSYDWKDHEERIDSAFDKYLPEVLEVERQKIKAILPEARAREYMEYFERGLESGTGIIMLEGANRRWLEIAYHAGYTQKVLFRHGYFAGLTQLAEKDR